MSIEDRFEQIDGLDRTQTQYLLGWLAGAVTDEQWRQAMQATRGDTPKSA